MKNLEKTSNVKTKEKMKRILEKIKENNPNQPEFFQAVSEIFNSIIPVLEQNTEWKEARIFERMTEPERTIIFRVPWIDDAGQVQVNRGFRVEMNSAIGPYKGGLRFHPSVTLSILKFLAFEQTLKNALTGLPMGGAKGGSDFDPKGKSDGEIMKFCQAFMSELFRHIGHNTDVPAGDIGGGEREIGYLFGMYKKLKNEFTGVLTGKSLNWGGSHIRPEATGYGCVYFAQEMLKIKGDILEGKTCLVSGSGNVAQYTVEKLIKCGAKVLTMSDSDGYIYDPAGIDREKLDWIMELKNARRGRIGEYIQEFPLAEWTSQKSIVYSHEYNPIWKNGAFENYHVDCAFPCATENEINATDAENLIKNGVKLVAEGANMPCTPNAIKVFLDAGILYGPGKAANAGGVAVSGLEMSQNSTRYSWPREDVNARLLQIMKHIHSECLSAAEAYGHPGNYEVGANIAGFIKVAKAMMAQGVV
jgi:glutamate dehydrogenase (NADP+)